MSKQLNNTDVRAIVVFLVIALIMSERFKKKPNPCQEQYVNPYYWGGPWNY